MTGGLGPLVLSGALFLAPVSAAAFLPRPLASFPVLMALLVPATIGWLVASRAALHGGAPARFAVPLVLAVALVARLAWLVPPPLSDDLYRYLWDGRVGRAGIHPAEHPPSAAALAHLRDDSIWPRINHPDVPTIYPPAAQAYFRLLDRVAPTEAGARGGAAALDLLGVVLLAALLRARKRPPAAAVVAGWCPLSVMESAGGGHVDTLGAALLVGALLWGEAGRVLRGAGEGVLVAAALLVKPFPALLAPALLGPRARVSRAAWIAGCSVALLAALPYLSAGPKVLTGFVTYAEHWRFNDSLYSLLAGAGLSSRVARAVLVLAAGGLAVAFALRMRDTLSAAACAAWAGLALLPTVHPWYTLWCVPLLPFLPRAAVPAAFCLTALLPLSYAAAWPEALGGAWSEPGWTRPAIWIPVGMALVAGISSDRARRGRSWPGS